MDPKVDARIAGDKKWSAELARLQKLCLASGLNEVLKWGQPCYTLEGRNVVLIHGFKEYFALLFFKGALMKDPNGILIQQTENVQSARQIRFTNMGEVAQLERALNAYIQDAIEIEKSGAKVEMKRTVEFNMPAEFKAAMNKKPALRKAFEALTPGRQRAYLIHFSSAKQSKTREDRVAKAATMIMKGRGLLD
ncbi:YdeI/OmpD-associated family protein [Aestuariivirga litoralis]|uniref:YdeI/OmpD-associated family protein n=1 Tax=Aestuariivirga litoralis TaxID=2650924 RepID=UPI0018C794E2|nr:YdeI/OmpD-associated family protein [Aestuariivirga litoralis]MBG1232187.1 hypothetical protein [Aestuariivirga litoralis]